MTRRVGRWNQWLFDHVSKCFCWDADCSSYLDVDMAQQRSTKKFQMHVPGHFPFLEWNWYNREFFHSRENFMSIKSWAQSWQKQFVNDWMNCVESRGFKVNKICRQTSSAFARCLPYWLNSSGSVELHSPYNLLTYEICKTSPRLLFA